LEDQKWGNDWKYYYNIEPFNYINDKEKEKNILGGEAVLFGDQIDSINFDYKAFPGKFFY
jgi:hypothetical protein